MTETNENLIKIISKAQKGGGKNVLNYNIKKENLVPEKE